MGRVDHVPPRERVDERVAERPGGRLLPGDVLLGERGQQQLARVVVKRRVGGDRRRAADRRQLAGRPEVAQDDRPRREAVGVVRDRRDVFVAGRQPGAAEPLGVGDRAALPQVVLDRVGIGGPLRLEVGEVGRPVADRAGDDLVAGAGFLVLAGSRESRGKRSSTAMSLLLEQFDRLLGAVEHGEARVLLLPPAARCRRRGPARSPRRPPRTGRGRGRSSGRAPGTARD